MGQQFHAGPWVGRTILRPVVEIALAYARWKYHLDLAKASPEIAVVRTQVPVLLIHGSADTVNPLETNAAILAETLPNCRLRVLEGCGHLPEIEVPAAVNALLRAFLAD